MTSGAIPKPRAEVEITPALVAELLRSQHPDLAELELRESASGWDNVIYRLGDDLTVRVPRRAAAATAIRNEQRWLPGLAPLLPLRVPVPVRVGRPSDAYPWCWSVTPWFPGDVAIDTELRDPTREAARLGAFMSALHHRAPIEAPSNPFRDCFVGDRTDKFDLSVPVLDSFIDNGAERARRRWEELVATPRFTGPPQWVAGDVHAANLIVCDGEISAVIDFGDICAGDPAVDLAVGWMLFGPDDRSVFRDAASTGEFQVDDDMWRRAEAWALLFAAMFLANSADDPRIARIGRDLALAVLD